MQRIAIIPARGGSKRIPRKNIRPFFGLPVIHYPIKICIESGLFDEVMVSTDDQEISEVAMRSGARVPFFRSVETSNDTATTAEVISEVLNSYLEMGMSFERFCCIYPVNPLLKMDHLRASERLLRNENVNGVQPVTRFSFPPQRAVRVLEGGRISWVYPEHATTRSQDLEDQYHDVGQFYWWKTSRFLEEKLLVGKDTHAYIIPESDVQDIDTEQDWKLAEDKYRYRNSL